MKNLYASLIGPLLGLYYPLPSDDETEARLMLNSSKLKDLWCGVYTRDEAERQTMEYGGALLPDEFAKKLDYDDFAVSSQLKALAKGGAS